MEPEPPPITIVNPEAPAGTPDLLSGGRDPWRPTRRQWTVTATAVALIAAVAGAVALGRHRQHDRELDAASAREVLLTAVVEPEPLAISVSSLRPEPIRILRATLLPGGAALALDQELVGGLAFTLPWLDSRPCTLGLLQRPLMALKIEARTSRGVAVSRTLDLIGNPDLLNEHARTRCGYLTPEEAFGAPLVHVTRVERGMRVRLTLSNRSVLPLTLSHVEVPFGMTLTGLALPVVLPPLAAPAHLDDTDVSEAPPGTEVRLDLLLRITDCVAFLGQPLEINPFLDVVVHGPSGSRTVQIALDNPVLEGQPYPGEFAAFHELARDCGRRPG